MFKLVENNSGATLIIQSAVSDATGQAIATYRAGDNGPAQDVVQAQLPSNGSVSSIVIDVAAGLPGIHCGRRFATSVTAGQVSIVTATLTGDNNAGVTVTFTLPINSSGATLSAATATTDGSGKAVVIYQPGTASPTLSVSGYGPGGRRLGVSSTAVITRTGSATSTFSITVAASPSTLAFTTSTVF